MRSLQTKRAPRVRVSYAGLKAQLPLSKAFGSCSRCCVIDTFETALCALSSCSMDDLAGSLCCVYCKLSCELVQIAGKCRALELHELSFPSE